MTIAATAHIIVGETLVEALDEVRPNLNLNPATNYFYLKDLGEKETPEGYIDLAAELEKAEITNPATTSEIRARSPLCYIFTSGTTGKPKAAIIEHARWIGAKVGFGAQLQLTPEDKIYIPLPFSHSTALLVAWGPAIHGGAATVMRRKFSVSGFWPDVKKYNVTAFAYIGELCRYLINQPPQPDDGDNSVEKIIGNGLRPDIWMEFKQRFDISQIAEFYASSEGNAGFGNMLNLDCTIGMGAMSQKVVKYDIEADELIKNKKGFLQKVKKGEAGLLIGEITDDNRFVGYTSNEATQSKILRNVFKKDDAWFNTGDLVKNIGFAHYQFVDRVGDTFRWKSENVSTTEVEEIITTMDQVKECTVYGVEIPGTVGRAGMASIITKDDVGDFDFQDFIAYMRKHLPAYAVPVFLRFQEEFEVTPTMKRIKSRLKQGGYNPQEVNDPLYVMLPGEDAYQHLTEEIYKNTLAEKYRF